MNGLLKLSLATLTVFVLAGCGGGGGGGGSSNGGGGGGGGNDEFTNFLSDFPSLGTSGYAVVMEGKSIGYEEPASLALAIAFENEISGRGDFNYAGYPYSYDIDSNNFQHRYNINNPASKGLGSGYIDIGGDFGESYIDMVLIANGRISNGKFAEVFGELPDDDLLTWVLIDTTYDGDLTSKFDAYYADVTGSGKLFDLTSPYVDCGITNSNYAGADSKTWLCERDDGATHYEFIFVSVVVSGVPGAASSGTVFNKWLY
jgi:hypothetical protein